MEYESGSGAQRIVLRGERQGDNLVVSDSERVLWVEPWPEGLSPAEISERVMAGWLARNLDL